MAAGDHTRNRVGNCSMDRNRWPCPTVQLEEATEALKIHQTSGDYEAGQHFASLAATQKYEPMLTAANALAVLVAAARTALDGSHSDFGRALLAMWAGLDAYQKARGQAPVPAEVSEP